MNFSQNESHSTEQLLYARKCSIAVEPNAAAIRGQLFPLVGSTDQGVRQKFVALIGERSRVFEWISLGL
jgi:hypothetical protein